MGNEVLRGAGREPRTAWSWLRKIVEGGRRWQKKLRSGEGRSLNQLASTCSNVFEGDQSSYWKTSVSFATVVRSMKLELRTKARLGINRDKRRVQYSESSRPAGSQVISNTEILKVFGVSRLLCRSGRIHAEFFTEHVRSRTRKTCRTFSTSPSFRWLALAYAD